MSGSATGDDTTPAHRAAGPEPSPGIRAVRCANEAHAYAAHGTLEGPRTPGLVVTRERGEHARVFTVVPDRNRRYANGAAQVAVRVELYVAGVPLGADGVPDSPFVGRTLTFDVNAAEAPHAAALTGRLAELFLTAGQVALTQVYEGVNRTRGPLTSALTAVAAAYAPPPLTSSAAPHRTR